MTAFLHFISQQVGEAENQLERAKALGLYHVLEQFANFLTLCIASVFGPAVLRDNADVQTISPLAKREFILFFIT